MSAIITTNLMIIGRVARNVLQNNSSGLAKFIPAAISAIGTFQMVKPLKSYYESDSKEWAEKLIAASILVSSAFWTGYLLF